MSSTVMPAFRYRDAPKAIDWLCDAFGFQRSAVYPNPDGTIAHAQLTYGTGMVMLGSSNDSDYEQFVQADGVPTVGMYVIVSDVDGHAERARAAGAEILMEPEDQDYGGRGYTCRDLEGNVWSFGSYDPWAETG